MQRAEPEIPEEIRKHLAPWRQTLLEIMDKVRSENENAKPRSKQKART